MELPMGLSPGPRDSIAMHPRRHPDLPSGLELNSSQLTAGRDFNITINAGHRKQPLPDTRQLAQWLSSLNQHQVHKDIFDKVTPGTGEWIFNNPQFMDWLAKNIDILWGTGIPGAGKTCLSSVIINHLTHHEQATVVFFYCQYKEQPSLNEIIACILKQMVESSEDAAEYVALTIHASCARTNTRPSLSELSNILKETAQKFGNLFFVVDALDELLDDTRSDLITELAALQFPLLITSRPIPNLFDVEPTEFTIRSPDDDIYKFISAKISRVSKLKPFLRDQSIRAELIRSVQDKCDGMFLLAALQIEALASAGIINARGLREAVERLPDTLNDQYEITLQRIQSQSFAERTLAMRIILWVTHATWHLEVDELLEALTVDVKAASIDEDQRTTEETLVSVCLGLLTVEKESQTVRLIHFTAQEFFEASKESFLKNPHAFIANICAIYLTQVQVESRELTSHEELLKHKFKNPLIEYSCYNLGHHTSLSMIESNDETPKYVPNLFYQRGCAPIPLWPFEDRMDFGHAVHFAAVYGLVSLFEENMNGINQQSLLGCSALFYACLGGHLMLVERITAECRACLSCKTGSGATLVHAAVQSGNASIVGMLLSMCGLKVTLSDSGQCIPGVGATDEDICIDINAQMSDGRTALYIASRNGCLPAVEALLSCLTVNPNLSDNSGWTPLHHAVVNDNESIVRLLLNTPNIDINAKASDVWAPLFVAVQEGNESIVRLLLDTPNIDVNAKNSKGWTPLHCAVQNGNESIVRQLLDTPNIDINAITSGGWTPLFSAVNKRNKSIVQLLLDKPNIDVNAKQFNGCTPLYRAVWIGNESIVRLLLDTPNIDINAESFKGWTPLHRAIVENGNESIVRLLLNMPDIDINAKASDEWTPLYCAVLESGNEFIVRLLLNMPNIDINAKDSEGWTPLHCAVQNGNESIVRLLLDTPNIDINAKASGGWTPLFSAVNKRNESIVQLLLDKPNIDVNAKEFNGCTPLYLAVRKGNESVVRLLLNTHSIDINAKESDRWTPLHIAVDNGNESIVRLLLDKPNIDVNAKEFNGCTPLYLAVRKGNESVVRLLLNTHSIDINAKESDRWTPLHIAVDNGNESIVRLLLDTPNIDINAEASDGWTPLHIAVDNGNESIVRLLLDTPNIDINAEASDGWTPLHIAVDNGNESIVCLLLDTPNIDVNAQESDGWTPLHLAAQNNKESIAKLLLSSLEIEVNALNKGGLVPLHVAARNGHTPLVQLFIRSPLASSQVSICARGTDEFTPLRSVAYNTRLGEGHLSVDMRTYNGITPLAYAAEYGHTSIAQLLVDSALVNVNNIDNDDYTPLMCAAYNGHGSVARILLSQPNILVNVQDKEHRRTALSRACDAATSPRKNTTKNEAEAYPFVVLLLEHKDIDINLANDEGKTPLYYASSSGFHKIVELLQERGALIQNTNTSPHSD